MYSYPFCPVSAGGPSLLVVPPVPSPAEAAGVEPAQFAERHASRLRLRFNFWKVEAKAQATAEQFSETHLSQLPHLPPVRAPAALTLQNADSFRRRKATGPPTVLMPPACLVVAVGGNIPGMGRNRFGNLVQTFRTVGNSSLIVAAVVATALIALAIYAYFQIGD